MSREDAVKERGGTVKARESSIEEGVVRFE
jgi:hypothetical protein